MYHFTVSHIHNQPGQHDLTVSMYIIRTDFDSPKLLMHWHKKLNKWLQFGGHVELGENPWQAVDHEIKEESGYDLSQLEILQPKDRLTMLRQATLHPQPLFLNTHAINDSHSHIDLGFVFTTNEEPLESPAENESEKIIMVDRNELKALSENDIFDSTKDACLYAFDILGKWDKVNTLNWKL